MNKLSIIEKINSVEDAYNHLGVDRNEIVKILSNIPEKDQAHVIAGYDLAIGIRALNEGWEPDWGNWDEYKYYNCFYADKSGAFRFYYTDCTYTYTYFGSRLCCKTEEIAKHAGKIFENQYRQYFLI